MIQRLSIVLLLSLGVCHSIHGQSPSVLILKPPTLISPADGDTLSAQVLPKFVWTPVFVSAGVQALYRLTIVPIQPSQTARDAIVKNKPLCQRTLQSSSYQYQASDTAFVSYQTAIGFGWWVQALTSRGDPATRNEGKSNHFTFQYISFVQQGVNPCCCCIEEVKIEDVKDIDGKHPTREGDWKGLEFTISIKVSFKNEGKDEGRNSCLVQWFEKAIPPGGLWDEKQWTDFSESAIGRNHVIQDKNGRFEWRSGKEFGTGMALIKAKEPCTGEEILKI